MKDGLCIRRFLKKEGVCDKGQLPEAVRNSYVNNVILFSIFPFIKEQNLYSALCEYISRIYNLTYYIKCRFPSVQKILSMRRTLLKSLSKFDYEISFENARDFNKNSFSSPLLISLFFDMNVPRYSQIHSTCLHDMIYCRQSPYNVQNNPGFFFFKIRNRRI